VRVYLACCIAFAALCVWAKDEMRNSRSVLRRDAAHDLDVAHAYIARSRDAAEGGSPVLAREDEAARSLLSVALVDRASGEPLDGRVVLWAVDGSRTLVELLFREHRDPAPVFVPEGCYEAFVLTDPVRGATPTRVVVDRRTRQLQFQSSRRRTYEGSLRIVDARGSPVSGYRTKGAFSHGEYFVPGHSHLVEVRGRDERKRGFQTELDSSGVYPLGTFREPGAGYRETRRYWFERDGWALVELEDSAAGMDHRYEALAVSEEDVRPSILLPSGALAEGAEITILSRAQRTASHGPGPVVEVRVRLSGYDRLRFEVRADEVGRLAPRTLEPLVSFASR